MYLKTGKSSFYCFNEDLKVHADTSLKNSYPVFHVKIDENNNEWVKVSDKYIVKLNNEINSFEFITNDKNLLFVGDW